MCLYLLPNSRTPVGCTGFLSSSCFGRKVLPFFSFPRADKAVHLQMGLPGLRCHSGNVNFPSSSEPPSLAATCLLSGTFSRLFLPIVCSSVQPVPHLHVLIPSGSWTTLIYTAAHLLHSKLISLGTVLSVSVSLEPRWKMWSTERGCFLSLFN